MIDLWNPDTFSAELKRALKAKSKLVFDYHSEACKLMDEHLNCLPYQSLKPNRFYTDFLSFQEYELAPILAGTRIRAWHYTRLLDYEAAAMQQGLVASSLEFLKKRLNDLVDMNLLFQEEADKVFQDSPFQSQGDVRLGRFWTITVPLPYCNPSVSLLLGNWGGESAYFWLSDKALAKKLRNLGVPRILEIETALSDDLNAFSASRTVLEAWANKLGVPVVPTGCDLAITNCLGTARLLRVHTEGERTFEAIATTYPRGVHEKTTLQSSVR
ncbi:MAG: hypothetical protein RLO04_01365 [Limnobacter sp.]|uniref:hypothetical protein n=1 Tax=Limnobacter sp. TaxID=2003368 RepID=UPI0032ED9107